MKIINRYVLCALLLSLNLSFGGIATEARMRAHQALMKASERGDPAAVQKALAEGAEINTPGRYGYTALMYGINNKAVVKILLRHGAIVNAQEPHGNTALMLAVKGDRLDIAKLLVGNGADINIQDEEGETALMMAENSPKIVEFLLNAGANVHAKNKAGFTALRLAYNKKTKLVLQEFMARAA